MASKTQSFENHAKWNPLYHFVASPIAMFYFAHTALRAFRAPSAEHALQVVFAFGLVAAVVASRLQALTVQNRVIRLEMRLRLRELLPPALAARIGELSTRQLIGLRFAGDAELPGLVERTLRGEFDSQKAIKRAITDWQADHLRA